jgi:hypothetical protein
MSEFLALMEKWDGYRPARAARFSEAALTRTLNLITNADGRPLHEHRYVLQEAMVSGDFPALFGGVLNLTLLGKYNAALPEWRKYLPTGTLPDFRVTNDEKISGNEQLLALVAERAAYPETAMAAGNYTRQVFKRGRQFDMSWESLVNDSLGAFTKFQDRFVSAALYTESWLATSLYCGAAAPNAALFGAPVVDVADGANVTNVGVLPLSITNLGITMQLMASQVDVQGRPLGIRATHLVVPPALEFTARAILTSSLMLSTAAAPIPDVNIMSQVGLQLHVDPLIPMVMPVAAANRTWFLFADTVQGKWGQVDFLAGHESPEICMKASNKVSASGGGVISPFDGDFDTDDILWRVRHVLGASVQDPRCAYAQVGP